MPLSAFFRRLVSHFSSSTRPSPSVPEKINETVPAAYSSTSSTTNNNNNNHNNTAKMPGTTNAPGRFNQIPGPLGLESASLAGKVALVTGAGTYHLFFLLKDVAFACMEGCHRLAPGCMVIGAGLRGLFTPTQLRSPSFPAEPLLHPSCITSHYSGTDP